MHQPKSFDHLIQECHGFLSENQLKNHFTLYQGYVKKLGEIEERLAKSDPASANYSFSEYSELRRREPVAYNGTVLHEFYFSNLGTPNMEVPATFRRGVEASFPSMDAWLADVKAIVGSGHGWCLTTYDWNFNRVRNNLVSSEHHVGLMPNQSLLIAIDAWEHAYFMDYGTKKADYVAKALQHLNWRTIETRMAMTPLSGKQPPHTGI